MNAPESVSPSLQRRQSRGYTLVELLLVMGIIIMVITLVLISVNASDYFEALLFARIKILPGTQRRDGKTMTLGLLASVDDSNGRSIRSAYRLAMKVVPSPATGRNDTSTVSLERFAGGSGNPLS